MDLGVVAVVVVAAAAGVVVEIVVEVVVVVVVVVVGRRSLWQGKLRRTQPIPQLFFDVLCCLSLVRYG